MLNLFDVQIGQQVRLKDGRTGEVTDNVGDGMWLELRDLATGEEELVHCEDMAALVDEPA